MIYYESKLAIVRTSRMEDVKHIAENMRPEDKAEIWKFDHNTPEQALMTGYRDSIECLTVEKDNEPIAMFGIVPDSILSYNATIWLLGTPKIISVQLAFAKYSKYFIHMMFDYYPVLSNYVDVMNRKTIRWLKWCGAKFSLARPYGIEQQPFQYFQFKRG